MDHRVSPHVVPLARGDPAPHQAPVAAGQPLVLRPRLPEGPAPVLLLAVPDPARVPAPAHRLLAAADQLPVLVILRPELLPRGVTLLATQLGQVLLSFGDCL